jgi:predicted metal-dependent enzyme (double-stranded beta helix superfamily)
MNQGKRALLPDFITDLDAICGGNDADCVKAEGVKARLSNLIASRPRLPEQSRRTSGTCYGRHLLYGDPEGRFEVVVMTWAPGQQTPVHDHAGIWCVEGVIEGVVDVTRYSLLEMTSAGTAHMEAIETLHAGLGQCGALIPPVEYHRISNPYEALALTVHVYGGRMRSCRVFQEADGGLYRVANKKLEYTTRLDALSIGAW